MELEAPLRRLFSEQHRARGRQKLARCNFVHNIDACFSDGEPPQGVPLAEISGVFFLAQEDLFRRLGVDDPVKIKSVEPTEWSDTSLGLPKPGVSYDQVIVRGSS